MSKNNSRFNEIKNSSAQPEEGNVKELFSNADGYSNVSSDDDTKTPNINTSSTATEPPKKDSNNSSTVTKNTDGTPIKQGNGTDDKFLGIIPIKYRDVSIVLMVAAVIGGGYYLYHKHKK